MAQYIKVGGTWRQVSADQDNNCGYVKVGGTWRSVTNSYVKIGGTWKSVCEPAPVTTTTTTSAPGGGGGGTTTTTTTTTTSSGGGPSCTSPNITNASTSNITSNSVNVSFNVSGMQSYKIFGGGYDSGTINSTATSVVHNVQGLTCNTSYTLTIVAWGVPNGIVNQSSCQIIGGVPQFNTSACVTVSNCTVPNVIGQSLTTAQTLYANAGFTGGLTESSPTTSGATSGNNGTVASQSLSIGASLACSTAMTVSLYSYTAPSTNPSINSLSAQKENPSNGGVTESATQQSVWIVWTSTNQATFSVTSSPNLTQLPSGTISSPLSTTRYCGLGTIGTTYTITLTLTSSSGGSTSSQVTWTPTASGTTTTTTTTTTAAPANTYRASVCCNTSGTYSVINATGTDCTSAVNTAYNSCVNSGGTVVSNVCTYGSTYPTLACSAPTTTTTTTAAATTTTTTAAATTTTTAAPAVTCPCNTTYGSPISGAVYSGSCPDGSCPGCSNYQQFWYRCSDGSAGCSYYSGLGCSSGTTTTTAAATTTTTTAAATTTTTAAATTTTTAAATTTTTAAPFTGRLCTAFDVSAAICISGSLGLCDESGCAGGSSCSNGAYLQGSGC